MIPETIVQGAVVQTLRRETFNSKRDIHVCRVLHAFRWACLWVCLFVLRGFVSRDPTRQWAVGPANFKCGM